MQKESEPRTHIGEIVNALPRAEAEHMRRVGAFTDLLSETAYLLGIYEDDAAWNGHEHFGEAAFYHDIGKAWVPREFLMKFGKLTRQEELILRLHPVHARILCEEIESGAVVGIPGHLLSLSLQAAEYHHERWDGTGYPHGLGTTEIPLIARLTAICDTYDTITSKRAYKEALSHDAACRELQINAGTQFDPLLTEVFLKNDCAFAQMRDRLPV
jgi:putative two-component system response regulator